MAEKISIDTPIQFHDALPDETDVVVIGAGVIGICSALYLARAGKRVCVVEKGRVAAEQSSRNWGWIRQHGRDEAELPIVMEAMRLWRELDSETKGETGFTTVPVNYLASSEKEMRNLEAFMEVAKRHGVNSVWLDRKQVAEQFGGVSNAQWVGGTATLDDARAEPWQAVPAIARLAGSEGVVIRENCAARTLEITNGQITGLHTEDGLIKCAHVVLAAGAWSVLFARNHGVTFPQLSLRSTAMQTEPMEEFTQGNSADELFAIRRRADGGYTLAICDGNDFFIGPDAFRSFIKYLPLLKKSWDHTYLKPFAPKDFPDAWSTARKWTALDETPFERCRVIEPEPNKRNIENALKRFEQRFHKASKPRLKKAWAGMIDALPDVLPLMDKVEKISGLVIATGMCGHGFGIGPGAGMVVRDLVLGNNSPHDLTRFRLSRFSDGSKMEPGPAL